MSTDQVAPRLDKIRSHAITLKTAASTIIDNIDAGQLSVAATGAGAAESFASGLSDLLLDEIERRKKGTN